MFRQRSQFPSIAAGAIVQGVRNPWSNTMTIKYAKSQMHAARCTLTRDDDGEYRVNLIEGNEKTAYYTSDLDDAVATGHAMRLRAGFVQR